jgi:hypothetical protein
MPVRSMLLAMPIYTIISLHLPSWLQNALVIIFKAFSCGPALTSSREVSAWWLGVKLPDQLVATAWVFLT